MRKGMAEDLGVEATTVRVVVHQEDHALSPPDPWVEWCSLDEAAQLVDDLLARSEWLARQGRPILLIELTIAHFGVSLLPTA
jgi:hypothetical protein